MSKEEKKPKVKSVKENLFKIIRDEANRLNELMEQKKHKQVA
jgi:hypothetical protein